MAVCSLASRGVACLVDGYLAGVDDRADGIEARAQSLIVELARRSVVIDGRRVELAFTEFELLHALAQRPGEPIAAQTRASRMK
jgi:DNA-binding response OmpR family regulator